MNSKFGMCDSYRVWDNGQGSSPISNPSSFHRNGNTDHDLGKNQRISLDQKAILKQDCPDLLEMDQIRSNQNKDLHSDGASYGKLPSMNHHGSIFRKKNKCSYAYGLEKPELTTRSNHTGKGLIHETAGQKITASVAIVEAMKLCSDPPTTWTSSPGVSAAVVVDAKMKSVHFAIDPITGDVLTEDINQVLLTNEFNDSKSGSQQDNSISRCESSSFNSFRRDSYHLSSLRRDSYFGLGSQSLQDLSQPTLSAASPCIYNNLPMMDPELLEDKVEKLPLNLLSKSHDHTYYHKRVNEDDLLGLIETNDVTDSNRHNRRTIRGKRKKFQQFYNRKEYRFMFRVSKHAAEEFISNHKELVQQFFEFYMSSLRKMNDNNSSDTKEIYNSDEKTQTFLRRWCESDGRGLEHAILLS